MSQLILQPFRRFTYVTAHSPVLPSHHIRHSSFSNYPSLRLRHSSFSKLSLASPMSQHTLQPFLCFTYVIAHSPTFPSLNIGHRSFSNPSVASFTSQHTVQPFRLFTYFTAHTPTLPSFHLRHIILESSHRFT